MKGLLFTYALTYGGAAASLFNPFYGLLVYICFAIIRPESMWFYSVPQGNYSRVIALALLVGWALKGFGNWNFGRSRATVLALVGFFIWMCVCAFTARDSAVAWADVEAKFKVVLPCLVGFTVIENTRQLKQLAWVIMLSQGWVAYEANMSYLGGFNSIHELGFGGMDNNCVAIAMVCASALAFFLGLAETVLWRRWLAFVAAGLMAHAVMLAESRGGMLGLLVSGAASFILIRKRPVYYAYLLLAVGVGFYLAGPSVWKRFNSSFAEEGERDYSAQSRVDLWNTCFQVMLREPVFGLGTNQFPVYASELGFTKGKSAHSLWMELGAENGIPGLGFLLAFYLLTMWRLWWVSKLLMPVAPEVADGCRMVIASLLGFMISAQFVSLLGLELPYFVALIGGGYLKLSDSILAQQDSATADFLAPPVPLGHFVPAASVSAP